MLDLRHEAKSGYGISNRLEVSEAMAHPSPASPATPFSPPKCSKRLLPREWQAPSPGHTTHTTPQPERQGGRQVATGLCDGREGRLEPRRRGLHRPPPGCQWPSKAFSLAARCSGFSRPSFSSFCT